MIRILILAIFIVICLAIAFFPVDVTATVQEAYSKHSMRRMVSSTSISISKIKTIYENDQLVFTGVLTSRPQSISSIMLYKMAANNGRFHYISHQFNRSDEHHGTSVEQAFKILVEPTIETNKTIYVVVACEGATQVTAAENYPVTTSDEMLAVIEAVTDRRSSLNSDWQYVVVNESQ